MLITCNYRIYYGIKKVKLSRKERKERGKRTGVRGKEEQQKR
jgi:hypothetical protein